MRHSAKDLGEPSPLPLQPFSSNTLSCSREVLVTEPEAHGHGGVVMRSPRCQKPHAGEMSQFSKKDGALKSLAPVGETCLLPPTEALEESPSELNGRQIYDKRRRNVALPC